MKKLTTSQALYAFFYAVSALFVIVSLFAGPINTLLPGLGKIMTSSELLTVDSTAVGGLNAAVPTTLNLPNIKGGKKLIYTGIELDLAAIDDFAKLGETDPMFAKLDEICKRHNGLWNAEAEKYLLTNAKAI